MIRRLLISGFVVILVQTSLPISASAQQAAPAKSAQTTSASARIDGGLPQAKPTLDWQNAARRFVLTDSAPLTQTLRQTTGGGGGGSSRQKLLLWGIIVGAGIGILALENVSPKGSDARCSSTNPQFCS